MFSSNSASTYEKSNWSNLEDYPPKLRSLVVQKFSVLCCVKQELWVRGENEHEDKMKF